MQIKKPLWKKSVSVECDSRWPSLRQKKSIYGIRKKINFFLIYWFSSKMCSTWNLIEYEAPFGGNMITPCAPRSLTNFWILPARVEIPCLAFKKATAGAYANKGTKKRNPKICNPSCTPRLHRISFRLPHKQNLNKKRRVIFFSCRPRRIRIISPRKSTLNLKVSKGAKLESVQ